MRRRDEAMEPSGCRCRYKYLSLRCLNGRENGRGRRGTIKLCRRVDREPSEGVSGPHSESRTNQKRQVGVAAFDLRSASLHLSQYIETSYHMVGVSELVDKSYASNKKVTLPRGCFDDTKGAVLVKSLAAKEPSVLGLGTFYKQYYLCLAAAAATIKWIEAEKGVIVINRSLLVTFNGSFDHMNIDATSVQNLEIIDPLQSELWSTSNKKRSLFQMLKTTKTVGGSV
ncbi:hypothetical protein OPV22_029880 [Ensete ventricosum]|uniref:Uncharacterized protein n=1 Tax=Ensete ventricosum TaxID=4639 RepID=A0AAV8QCI1_ENSVE|nr:hypothetical protein OPV22_029880 [Ensete ventricosum]